MKPTVLDPKSTSQAEAYALWRDAPNPMVTFFKTLDISPLVKLSRRRGLKFNMLHVRRRCAEKCDGGNNQSLSDDKMIQETKDG